MCYFNWHIADDRGERYKSSRFRGIMMVNRSAEVVAPLPASRIQFEFVPLLQKPSWCNKAQNAQGSIVIRPRLLGRRSRCSVPTTLSAALSSSVMNEGYQLTFDQISKPRPSVTTDRLLKILLFFAVEETISEYSGKTSEGFTTKFSAGFWPIQVNHRLSATLLPPG